MRGDLAPDVRGKARNDYCSFAPSSLETVFFRRLGVDGFPCLYKHFLDACLHSLLKRASQLQWG